MEKEEEKEIEKARKKYVRSEALDQPVQHVLDAGISLGITGLVAYISQNAPSIGGFLSEALPTVVQGGVEQVSDSILSKHQWKKREQFLDKIISCEKFVSEDELKKINKIDFIIEFEKTIEVIDRLARDKKVHYIANLFCKYFLEEHHEEVDPYEEALNQLSTLSYREIEILITLNQIESEKEASQKNEKAKAPFKFYIDCSNQLLAISREKWEIDPDEMMGILTGLCGTGFLREMNGTIAGYEGGAFRTTEYFKNFLNYILAEE